jgi:tetratricopeptide (TPR) repeat protein
MKHHLTTALLTIVSLLAVLLFATSAFAQDDGVVVSPEPTPVDVEALVVQVQDALIKIEELEGRANDMLGVAMDMFGLFEGFSGVFGIALPVIVAVAGFFGYRRLERAGDELREARERFDREIEAKQQELENVQKALEKTIEEQKSSATNSAIALGLLTVGRNQYKAKDNTGAIKTFNQALEYDPQNPVLLYNLGYVYAQSDKFEQAIVALEKALEYNEDFAPAIAALGYVYRRMGDELNKDIKNMVNVEINNHDSKIEELRTEQISSYNRSEAYFIDALKRLPKLIDEDGESWWGALGGLYRRRGQVDNAIYAYEKGAEVTPKSSYPFSNLAMLQAEKRNFDEMKKRFARVEKLALGEIQADADNTWAFNDLIISRIVLGKYPDAHQALEEALQIATQDSPYALKSLQDTLTYFKDVLDEEAQEHIDKILQTIREKQS